MDKVVSARIIFKPNLVSIRQEVQKFVPVRTVMEGLLPKNRRKHVKNSVAASVV